MDEHAHTRTCTQKIHDYLFFMAAGDKQTLLQGRIIIIIIIIVIIIITIIILNCG